MASLEYTPTWVVAVVCSVIVLVSFCAVRGLHQLGKFLLRKYQESLFEALQKLKEELMLLGFISLLLTVSQDSIIRICVPKSFASHMLPCKPEHVSSNNEHYSHRAINNRHLLSSDTYTDHCTPKGKTPLLSLEALHQLHIFIFVLAVVHVIFCCTTMALVGARINQWKYWEEHIRDISKSEKAGADVKKVHAQYHYEFSRHRAFGYWRKAAIVSWMISFFKQFYGSDTKSDYIALRQGFIMTHCPGHHQFDFHKYMMRTLEVDFKKVVGISWYLWLFVVLFLLLNIYGWHTFFWLAFLPLILLLLVGAKLEHIITRLSEEVAESGAERVKPSDQHFWFNRPSIVTYLIHFILFQNSFEIAFFFWIWSTYGFNSCIMEKLGYIITRLIMGVIIQVLCGYSTLPLYALVSQMGSMFKKGMFDREMELNLISWVEGVRDDDSQSQASRKSTEMNKLAKENVEIAEHATLVVEGTTTSLTELSSVTQTPMSSP